MNTSFFLPFGQRHTYTCSLQNEVGGGVRGSAWFRRKKSEYLQNAAELQLHAYATALQKAEEIGVQCSSFMCALRSHRRQHWHFRTPTVLRTSDRW